jgi:aspartyl-tRNA(Asn)/glutamyl-tRNA(Gln) amidotransferase subunit C
MSLTTDDVKKVASLARIRITDEEITLMKAQLNTILGWIDQLQLLKVDDIDLYSTDDVVATHEREDKVSTGPLLNDLMACAVEKKFDMYQVPKMVE